LAARFKQGLGVDTQLIKGGGGIFDVTVDGALVYSKHQTGMFPDENALLKQLSLPSPR